MNKLWKYGLRLSILGLRIWLSWYPPTHIAFHYYSKKYDGWVLQYDIRFFKTDWDSWDLNLEWAFWVHACKLARKISLRSYYRVYMAANKRGLYLPGLDSK